MLQLRRVALRRFASPRVAPLRAAPRRDAAYRAKTHSPYGRAKEAWFMFAAVCIRDKPPEPISKVPQNTRNTRLFHVNRAVEA